MIKRLVGHFRDRSYVKAFLLSFALLLVSLVINYIAGTYATEKMSNPVTDLILSNIPVFSVDDIFIWGGYALFAAIVLSLVAHPKKMPFAISAISLFYIIRSIFVTLTHIAPFPTHTIIDPSGIMRLLDFDGELFFSGHTGLPFLMALIFWNQRGLRYFFLAASIFLGAVVLMGHVHYSIDVFGAFFITYSIFHMAQVLFRKFHRLAADVEMAALEAAEVANLGL